MADYGNSFYPTMSNIDGREPFFFKGALGFGECSRSAHENAGFRGLDLVFRDARLPRMESAAANIGRKWL
jgi:hypothetical protein